MPGFISWLLLSRTTGSLHPPYAVLRKAYANAPMFICKTLVKKPHYNHGAREIQYWEFAKQRGKKAYVEPQADSSRQPSDSRFGCLNSILLPCAVPTTLLDRKTRSCSLLGAVALATCCVSGILHTRSPQYSRRAAISLRAMRHLDTGMARTPDWIAVLGSPSSCDAPSFNRSPNSIEMEMATAAESSLRTQNFRGLRRGRAAFGSRAIRRQSFVHGNGFITRNIDASKVVWLGS